MVMALASVALVSFVACSSSDSTAPGGESSSSGSSGNEDGGKSSSSGGTTSSSGQNANITTTAYATAVCARQERCSPGLIEQRYGDQTTCAHNVSGGLLTFEESPNSGQTATTEGPCAAKLASDPCDTVIPECDFKGTQTTGGACSTGIQCATGSCLFASQQDQCGKCAVRAKLGETCAAAGAVTAECEPPNECDSSTNKCAALAAVGASCVTLDCAPGGVCIGGTCKATIAAGQPCTKSISGSDQDPCDSTSLCSNGTCTKITFTAKAGETCTETTGCIDGVCAGGKCVANAKENQPCSNNAETPPFCEPPMACANGVCKYLEFPTCK
jgi:hypothetical protein